MNFETKTGTPSGDGVTTIHAALEVSDSGWILTVGDPANASGTGLHRLAPRDVDGPPGRLGQARVQAERAFGGGGVRVPPVYEAGYEGFWLARRLEGEDLEVVVRDPAGLEVVRRRKKAKTDRIDARGWSGRRGPGTSQSPTPV